jgi:hypothetical protein
VAKPALSKSTRAFCCPAVTRPEAKEAPPWFDLGQTRMGLFCVRMKPLTSPGLQSDFSI